MGTNTDPVPKSRRIDRKSEEFGEAWSRRAEARKGPNHGESERSGLNFGHALQAGGRVFEPRTAHWRDPLENGRFSLAGVLQLVPDARLWKRFWKRLGARQAS
jgi:hypothetical protein